MIKQTLTWTALPNGSNGPKQAGTELRLSVYVAPRLWNDDANVTSMPLSDFADWLDWPAQVAQASFEVAFDGGPTLAAVPENVNLRSDLWQALFKPATTVKPFLFEDRSGAKIKSFSAGTVHDTLVGVYQRAAIDATYGGGTDLPGRGVLAGDPDLSDIARPVEPQPPYEPPPDLDRGPVFVGEKGPPEPEPDPISGGEEGDGEEPGDEPGGCRQGCVGCLLWPFQLLQRLFGLFGLSVFPFPASAESLPEPAALEPGDASEPTPDQARDATEDSAEADLEPAPRPVLLAAASAQQKAFDDLHAYAQPHSKVSHALPTQAEVEDQYDFHQMISSLGDYPALVRQMGLVVDLVVTLDANLPADVGKVSVALTPPPGMVATHATPMTHYDLGDGVFRARPRAGSDLAEGLLRLNEPARFKVVQTDVAGGGLKLQNTATNVRGLETLAAWPANAPEDAGLPALQTAGVSIVRSEQVNELVRRMDHSFALNTFLATLDASPVAAYQGAGPPPAPSDDLFADDLVRGYRMDVWDDQSGVWHSLSQRLGNYDFLDGPAGTITVADLEDEGFVQLAATESRDEAADPELRVHESLFSWDGWSLAAPRPGQSILPDHTTGNSTNSAVTQFQLETAFRPKPASLPRLRFGWNYRVRARMVDLAGNSVFDPGDAEFANTQAQATAQFQFNRYEPVAPPSLMLRSSPVEAESLEHLVVRSSIHDAAADVETQLTERHVAPPKTSQHMAERHRVFDGTPDIRTDQAAYDLASREAGSMTERMNMATGTMELLPGVVKEEDPVKNRTIWLQPNVPFEIAFLPDNFARGVLLMGLPGMADPDNDVIADVNKIAFGGVWPDLEAFRLRLQGLDDGTAPAQPAWDPVDHVLTVQVPQGELHRVRYSSYFHLADLEQMGIWEWVKDAAPANLADLQDLAEEGRNWLHLPFRELDLVHAVQQPLTIPDTSQLAISPAKTIGATSVTLDGQVDIDAKSTGKVDLRAAWRDPIDDVSKPAFDATTDFDAKEMLVEEVTAHDRTDDQLEVKDVEHPFGDTKYHRVTYTAIGTTRYREYFPAAIQATPEEMVRPTPAEAGTQPADDARFELDIPNSARPDAVRPLYAVPIVSWSPPQVAGDVVVHRRTGGGLRMYMERPWYSSGDKELLGLVLRRAADPPLSDNWMKLRKYASEWGMDPLWRSDETAPLAETDFTNAVAQGSNLSIVEVPGMKVDAVGFEAQYDPDRNLWFSDVALDAATHYFPFVRLALARFHPISVKDAELSRIVLSDFIQVLPHRTVEYDMSQLAASNQIKITVNGPAYFMREREQFASPSMVARVERRKFDTGDELGWEHVTKANLPVLQPPPRVENTIWQGTLTVPNPVPSPMRIVVTEAEVFSVDQQRHPTAEPQRGSDIPIERGDVPSTSAPTKGLGSRVVFADTLELP